MYLSERLSQWTFKAGFASTMATFIILPILLILGFWQLHRAEEKDTLKNQMENTSNEILTLKDLVELDQTKQRFKLVQVEGTFLPSKHFLLDNQIHQKQVGFRVLSTFVTNDQHIVLIDRGFIAHSNRQSLPTIEDIQGQQIIFGRVNTPTTGIQLNQREESQDQPWPKVIQSVKSSLIAKLLPVAQIDAVIQLSEQSSYNYRWVEPHVGMPSNKHLAYAIQWFSMALATMIYYVVINVKRRHS